MIVYMVTVLSGITDTAAYQSYAEKARAVVSQHGGKFILASHGAFELTAIEGDCPDVVNVALFKDRQSYLSFYQSPEYRAIIPLRTAICKSQITMLEKL